MGEGVLSKIVMRQSCRNPAMLEPKNPDRSHVYRQFSLNFPRLSANLGKLFANIAKLLAGIARFSIGYSGVLRTTSLGIKSSKSVISDLNNDSSYLLR